MAKKNGLILAICALGLVAISVILVVTVIQAAPEDLAEVFSISWWTVDGGGGTSQGGSYALSGTIGQPDAGSLSGGNYLLEGGFWSGLIGSEYVIHLPLIVR
jgi:hypothetical protein